MIFQSDRLITFSDSDLAGFMFFAKAFDLAHQTLEQFISQSPIGWENWFRNSDFKVPLRHAEADFYAPILPGQTLNLQLHLKKIGDSSIHFSTQFFNEQTLCCDVITVHTFVSPDMKQKMAVPQFIIDSLS
ncbi:MAG: thioesterase family protein [Bdellovibrionales bacterium]|nr:thioesterase family protein [Bdellovibrionales bacterium]